GCLRAPIRASLIINTEAGFLSYENPKAWASAYYLVSCGEMANALVAQFHLPCPRASSADSSQRRWACLDSLPKNGTKSDGWTRERHATRTWHLPIVVRSH